LFGVKVGWQSGVVIATKQNRIILDPVSGRRVGRNARIFITHAHADHTYGLRANAKKYATPQTIAIYEKLNAKRLDNIVPLQINKSVKVGDIEVTAIHAGHMLGSAQFLVTTPEKAVLYTGDINCVDTLTTEAAQAVECDELIMEATYGDPFYVFPSRHKIYARIVEWATAQARKGRSPVFHAYAAGKAQEIVKLFNVYTTLPVVANPSISRVNEAHANFGVKLDYLDVSSRKMSEVLDGVHVLVTTTRDEPVVAERSIRAVATGWALKMRSRNFPSFPLSSHADFRQLANYVKATRAKRVYLYTGFTDVFSEFLVRKFGVDSKPLPALAQTELGDF
jgi:putative mRNA 3-end processing factor